MALNPAGPGTARSTALNAVRMPSTATILLVICPPVRLANTAPRHSTSSSTNSSGASLACAIMPEASTLGRKNG